MLGTYASAALICAASLLVGRAMLSLAGRSEWSWLEPAVGFGAIISVTGLLARVRRARHHARRWARSCWSLAAVVVVARLPLPRARRAPRRAPGRDRDRPGPHDPLPRQRPLGHDRGRLQQRPRPPPRLGGVAAQRLRARRRSPATRWARMGWRSPSPRCRGSSLGQAFLGEIFAIGVLTGLTALAALGTRRGAPHAGGGARRDHLPRRLLLRPGRLQGDRRGALRPRLRPRPARPGPRCPTGAWPRLRLAPPLPGARRRHLLRLQLRRPRLAGRDRRALEPDPARGAQGAGAAGAAARAFWRPRTLVVAARARRARRRWR